MNRGGYGGALELRAAGDGSATIAGRFPMGVPTELRAGRFEQFARGAFELERDVRFLAAHDFAKPLASVATGTLELRDEGDALALEARVTTEIAATSHGRDALALIRAGLAAGLSPGFQVPDAPGAESVERRGDGSLLRTVRRAVLMELSVVTRAAYADAVVEARSWSPTKPRRRGRWLA
jgi:hypothetical protein